MFCVASSPPQEKSPVNLITGLRNVSAHTPYWEYLCVGIEPVIYFDGVNIIQKFKKIKTFFHFHLKSPLRIKKKSFSNYIPRTKQSGISPLCFERDFLKIQNFSFFLKFLFSFFIFFFLIYSIYTYTIHIYTIYIIYIGKLSRKSDRFFLNKLSFTLSENVKPRQKFSKIPPEKATANDRFFYYRFIFEYWSAIRSSFKW